MPVWLCAFVLAFFVGTFVEYWGHRMMHSFLLRKKHAEHHRDGWGQGWFGEFIDYFVGAIPILGLGFIYSIEAGVGFLAGGLFYAAWAAYSHQLQHERPELCFWLRRPVHHLHHKDHMWHHNFGISFSLWDHVFRTYRQVEWNPPRRARDFPLRSFVEIKWF
jgi:sterol desaturase/sphingolipid hydroxylase (fatty acid hydroxylase superfamily)